jgi:hypothetical protein
MAAHDGPSAELLYLRDDGCTGRDVRPLTVDVASKIIDNNGRPQRSEK